MMRNKIDINNYNYINLKDKEIQKIYLSFADRFYEYYPKKLALSLLFVMVSALLSFLLKIDLISLGLLFIIPTIIMFFKLNKLIYKNQETVILSENSCKSLQLYILRHSDILALFKGTTILFIIANIFTKINIISLILMPILVYICSLKINIVLDKKVKKIIRKYNRFNFIMYMVPASLFFVRSYFTVIDIKVISILVPFLILVGILYSIKYINGIKLKSMPYKYEKGKIIDSYPDLALTLTENDVKKIIFDADMEKAKELREKEAETKRMEEEAREIRKEKERKEREAFEIEYEKRKTESTAYQMMEACMKERERKEEEKRMLRNTVAAFSKPPSEKNTFNPKKTTRKEKSENITYDFTEELSTSKDEGILTSNTTVNRRDLDGR